MKTDERKALQRLSDTLLLALADFDEMLEGRTDIERELSSQLAQWANVLDYENDMVRFFVLGVDHRTDDKAKVRAKLRMRKLK